MAAIRPYRTRDLGRVVELWEREGLVPAGPDGLSVDQALDLIASEGAHVLVAEHRGELVGVAVGAAQGPVGTLYRVSGDEEITDQLIRELEAVLAEGGARRIVARVHEDQPLRQVLHRREFRARAGMEVLERDVPGTTAGPQAVTDLGGRVVPPGLWDELKGMEEAKRLIERRVILPLEQPGLAERHGVSTPHAIMLFGPPGTGKTTFAKGVASRLGWPFVPIEPAQLGAGTDEESRHLARTFDSLMELPSAVAFVDEVEEIASTREDERRVPRPVTTEFLRQIPRLRESAHHLLVCATNTVSRLDPAFLRPGRFDHILPVGPPDDEARQAIWRRYIDEITDQDIDVAALVEASEGFTPADIEFAARKAAQLAFEREHFQHSSRRAATEDFLAAIGETPPTLTAEMVETFEGDVRKFARA